MTVAAAASYNITKIYDGDASVYKTPGVSYGAADFSNILSLTGGFGAGDDWGTLGLSVTDFSYNSSGVISANGASLSLENPQAGVGNYIINGDSATLGIIFTSGSNTVEIVPRALTVAWVGPFSFDYDRTQKSVSITLGNLVQGEDLTVAYLCDSAVSAGNYMAEVSGLADGNAGVASNYSLPGGGLSQSWSILKIWLTVLNMTAQSKNYDGLSDAVLVGGDLSGICQGDVVYIDGTSLTGVSASQNPGNWAVTTALVLAGADYSNYDLTQPGYITISISRKAVYITGLDAYDRAYDGTAAVTLDTSNMRLSGVVPGEDLLVSIDIASGIGSIPNKLAGLGKIVSVTASLSGINRDCYNLVWTDDAHSDIIITVDIYPLDLTLTAKPVLISKLYDGTAAVPAGVITDENISDYLAPAAIGAGDTLSDIISVEAYSYNFATVLDGNLVLLTISLSDALNYRLSVTAYDLSAEILPAKASSIDSLDIIYGDSLAEYSYAVSGVNSEILLAGDIDWSGSALSRYPVPWVDDTGEYSVLFVSGNANYENTVLTVSLKVNPKFIGFSVSRDEKEKLIISGVPDGISVEYSIDGQNFTASGEFDVNDYKSYTAHMRFTGLDKNNYYTESVDAEYRISVLVPIGVASGAAAFIALLALLLAKVAKAEKLAAMLAAIRRAKAAAEAERIRLLTENDMSIVKQSKTPIPEQDVQRIYKKRTSKDRRINLKLDVVNKVDGKNVQPLIARKQSISRPNRKW